MAQHFAEWIAGLGPGMANHLWQSTAFAAGAWLVTLALRQNQARVRHAVWLAASIKFLVPFSLLIVVGNLLPHPKQAVAPVVYSAMDVVEEPFAEMAPQFMAPAVHTPTMRERMEAQAPAVLGALWAIGAGVVLIVWASRWRAVSRVLRKAEVVREGREWEILRRLEGESSTSADMKSRSLDSARADPFDSASPRSGQAARASLGMTVHGVHRFRALKGAATPPTQAELGWGTRRDGWAIELRLSTERMEPGIFGVWRPVLVWPRELSARLDDEHIEAIVAHELAHVRRWDNLTAALHMLVETVFWFHPVVWWMERQMVKEREQACDEAVVAIVAQSQTGEAETCAQIYAEALLKTCRFCIESPLACVAGVTGADLKHRVVEIVTGRAVLRLSWPKKLLLVAAGACVVVAPVVLGQAKAAQRLMLAAINAAPKPVQTAAHAMLAEKATLAKGGMAEVPQAAIPAVNAAPAADDMSLGPEFEVAVIRPADPNEKDGGSYVDSSGTFHGKNTTLERLVSFAYTHWQNYGGEQVASEGPEWTQKEHFDVEAKLTDAEMAGWRKMTYYQQTEHVRPMLRRLLVDRFHLRLQTEHRVTEVYAFVVAKGGTKLKEVAPAPPLNLSEADRRQAVQDAMAHKGPPMPESFTMSGSSWSGTSLPFGTLAMEIAANAHLDGPLVNLTGLNGYYDFTMQVFHDGDAPPLLDQVEQQLGIKVEQRKMPLTYYIITSAEKPSVDGAEVAPAASVTPTEGAPARPQAGETQSHQPASFDAISIKLANSQQVGFLGYSGGRVHLGNANIRMLIYYGYDVPVDKVVGVPDWADPARYDIDAVPPDSSLSRKLVIPQFSATPTPEQREMIQSLLRDRFALKSHWETRESDVYFLTRGTKPLALEPPKYTDSGWRGAVVTKQGGIVDGEAFGMNISMAAFAGVLSGDLKTPVIDQTDLSGTFDFHIQPSLPENQDEEAGVFAAIDHLGLRLKRGRGPVRTLVIDHVERPSEN